MKILARPFWKRLCFMHCWAKKIENVKERLSSSKKDFIDVSKRLVFCAQSFLYAMIWILDRGASGRFRIKCGRTGKAKRTWYFKYGSQKDRFDWISIKALWSSTKKWKGTLSNETKFHWRLGNRSMTGTIFPNQPFESSQGTRICRLAVGLWSDYDD